MHLNNTKLYYVSSISGEAGHITESTLEGIALSLKGGTKLSEIDIFTTREEAEEFSQRLVMHAAINKRLDNSNLEDLKRYYELATQIFPTKVTPETSRR